MVEYYNVPHYVISSILSFPHCLKLQVSSHSKHYQSIWDYCFFLHFIKHPAFLRALLYNVQKSSHPEIIHHHQNHLQSTIYLSFPSWAEESTHRTKVCQSSNSHVSQRSMKWSNTLLLGNEASNTAIHLIGQVALTGNRRESQHMPQSQLHSQISWQTQ